jgi:hypothetical protein
MHSPANSRIASEWFLLFAPSRHGRHVNDDSLLRGPDGRWNSSPFDVADRDHFALKGAACGWRGWGTPIKGVVAIARLPWQ